MRASTSSSLSFQLQYRRARITSTELNIVHRAQSVVTAATIVRHLHLLHILSNSTFPLHNSTTAHCLTLFPLHLENSVFSPTSTEIHISVRSQPPAGVTQRSVPKRGRPALLAATSAALSAGSSSPCSLKPSPDGSPGLAARR